MKRFLSFIFLLLLTSLSFRPVFASDKTCLIYFTGHGCSHCAQVDPVLLEKLPKQYPDLVIIEYEIYQQTENAGLLDKYCQIYDLPYCRPGGSVPCCGIPLVIFAQGKIISGDKPILQQVEKVIKEQAGNPCPLVDGQAVDFEELDPSSLPGKPKILTQEDSRLTDGRSSEEAKGELTLAKVLSLAAVDAINPCALTVLTLILLAIFTLGSKKRLDVLFAGLAFSLAVFIMYLFYGLIIIRFFQIVQVLTGVKFWLYKILGLLAILLGVLNIKDFIRYQPGGLLTEMPLFLRPKMQNLFFKVTSPKGAFGVGLLVTLFLLPCTIGPYIICGGILCSLDFFQIIPWLLLYNFVFILPMIGITLIVYLGLTSTFHVSEWKEKNIRYLHLLAGIIILILGVVMLLGRL